MNIGIGITGSFCTHQKILQIITNLVSKGYNIIPIVTDKVYKTSTRFGSKQNFLSSLEQITKNKGTANDWFAMPYLLSLSTSTGNRTQILGLGNPRSIR